MSAPLRFICCLLFLLPAAFADRPNVVIFLADDQGWGDLSMNGNTNVRTPQIDSKPVGAARHHWSQVTGVLSTTVGESERMNHRG